MLAPVPILFVQIRLQVSSTLYIYVTHHGADQSLIDVSHLKYPASYRIFPIKEVKPRMSATARGATSPCLYL